VHELTRHPAFSRQNPNRMRALIGAFSQGNPLRFHDPSGASYALLADEVIAVDPQNPTTAARLVQPLCAWRRYDAARQALMREGLERVLATPRLRQLFASRGSTRRRSRRPRAWSSGSHSLASVRN
jgi:aminopeptidase N